MKNKKLNLTARMDRPTCRADGLFTSVAGRHKNQRREMHYELEGVRVTYLSFVALGDSELRVLQAVYAEAALSGAILPDTPKSPQGKKLRQELDEAKWEIAGRDTITMQTSIYRLAQLLGTTKTRNRSFIRKALENLATTSLTIDDGATEYRTNILSYSIDKEKECLSIVLHPSAATAIWGKQRYVSLPMHEIRELKTPAARLIHVRLCGNTDPGRTGRVGVERLSVYVWGPDKPDSKSTLRTRKSTIRKAIAEIRTNLGWVFTPNEANDAWEYVRPKLPKSFRNM